jgi:predicted nucleic acid-binding protein
VPEAGTPVVYWDASAILSVLIRDTNSTRATAVARRTITHLLSTLAFAEVAAVIARLERLGGLPAVLAEASRDLLRDGPWRTSSSSLTGRTLMICRHVGPCVGPISGTSPPP